MSMKYLGETFDIHTGGVDLIFPHHQNEIAQSEASTHRPFVRYWMHNEFVNIDGAAMSKSVGNNIRLQDIGNQEQIQAYRYLVVTSHYRTILNFTDEALVAARSARRRLNRLANRLRETSSGSDGLAPSPSNEPNTWNEEVQSAEDAFRLALDDDLNTPRAMAAIFALVGGAERLLGSGEMAPQDAAVALKFLTVADGVLGFLDDVDESEPGAAIELTPIQQQMLEDRHQARGSKDWPRSDELRDLLAAEGIVVTDGPDGQQWTQA